MAAPTLTPLFRGSKNALTAKPANAPSNAAATAVLNRNAVRFQGSAREDAGRAYPFFYPFLPSPYLDPLSQGGTTNFNVWDPTFVPKRASLLNTAPDGIVIFPGQTIDIHIRMNKDMNFDLLEARYTARLKGSLESPDNPLVYFGRSQRLGDSSFQGPVDTTTLMPSSQNPNAFRLYNAFPFDLPIPAYELLKVSLYVKSGVERPLYGGNSRIGRKETPLFGYEPIPIASIQGNDDGKGSVRCPYLISKEAVVTIRVTAAPSFDPWQSPFNSGYNNQILFDGLLFGYKTAI